MDLPDKKYEDQIKEVVWDTLEDYRAKIEAGEISSVTALARDLGVGTNYFYSIMQLDYDFLPGSTAYYYKVLGERGEELKKIAEFLFGRLRLSSEIRTRYNLKHRSQLGAGKSRFSSLVKLAKIVYQYDKELSRA